MTDTKPTLEEQIAALAECTNVYTPTNEAILASLKELQSIRSAELPVEPRDVVLLRHDRAMGLRYAYETVRYIDALKAYALKETEFRKEAQRHREMALSAAEKAESELAALRGKLMEPDALARACNLAGLDYNVFLKICDYLPVEQSAVILMEGK